MELPQNLWQTFACVALEKKLSPKNGVANVEFVTSGVELLWGNCTVFPVPVQGALTGGK